MTTTRTPTARRSPRPGRRAAMVFLASAGIVLTPLSAQASTGAPAPPPTAPVATAPVAAPNAAAQTAVDTALAQQGKPYVWAGAGPDVYDCSGLTQFAYAAAGVALPHSSRGQSELGVQVARADLQPGDLVFFYSPISHVGLYIGNGMMVHARTFGQPVAVTSVDQSGYRFAKRIVGG
jgi:cell wall-associated NlpC family hydrolase